MQAVHAVYDWRVLCAEKDKEIAHLKEKDNYHLRYELAGADETITNLKEQLAEKANVSRSHISSIEAPGIARPFSLEVFFNIADALEIDPADLISASVFPNKIINGRKG